MDSLEVNKLLENVPKPISVIEKQIGIPSTALQKAAKGYRPLPKRWSILLKDYVERKLYLVGNSEKKMPAIEQKYTPPKEVKLIEQEQKLQPVPEKHLSKIDQLREMRAKKFNEQQ